MVDIGCIVSNINQDRANSYLARFVTRLHAFYTLAKSLELAPLWAVPSPSPAPIARD